MKKKMVIISLFIMFLMPNFVMAGAQTDDVNLGNGSFVPNECLDNETCRVACNYENVLEDGKIRTITIYYYNDNRWSIGFNNEILKTIIKSPGTYNDTFSTSGSPNVYAPTLDSSNLQKLKCPSYAYLDGKVSEEICLANDEKWCDTKNNIGTEFTGKSTKTFDLSESLSKQSLDNITTCIKNATNAEISNYSADLKDCIDKAVEKDENADLNSNIYEYVEENFDKSVVQKLKDACLEEKNKGILSEGDYNACLSSVENTDFHEIQKNILASLSQQLDYNPTIEKLDCDSILGHPDVSGTPAYYLVFAFDMIKYVAIIILLIFSIIDFISATASSDKDILKKASTKAVKRLLLCVIIFLLPTVVEFVLKYLSNRAVDLCGIGGGK